jgi:outer membrane protein TolC
VRSLEKFLTPHWWAVFLLHAGIGIAPVFGEGLTLEQVLQRALAQDRSLQIAALQVQRAEHERARVESQLGWVLTANGGAARGVSQFGAAVDRLDAAAGIERRLPSGDTLGVGANIVDEDAGTASPFPLPSRTTGVDLNYRIPLGRGADNADYHQGLVIANASADIARADWETSRRELTRRASELYFAAALTHARLRAAEAAIERAERLQNYIGRNLNLGIAEQTDRLQAEAQQRARLAEQQALRVAWEAQRNALNRLMERPPNDEWLPVVSPTSVLPLDVAALQADALASDPETRRANAQLRIAQATIERLRDSTRNQADVVLSVGNRASRNDNGSLNESEATAGVRFEYRAALDQRGVAAELSQAYLDQSMARLRLSAAETELRYAIARLVGEISANQAALAQARARREAELSKLREAEQRHRRGRTDTAQLIQFENDYEAAVLAAEQQAIELLQRRAELDRIHGALWHRLESKAP